jgi:uncharacterized membrane protein YqjE
LVSIPLLAWWVGGRRAAEQSTDPYVSRDVIHRHGLQPDELEAVERAASWGKELQDERLRAAVVELAERQASASGGRRRPPMCIVVLFAAWGAALVAYLTFQVAQGRWGDANWFGLAYWLSIAVLGRRWQTGPARAMRLNRPLSAAQG